MTVETPTKNALVAQDRIKGSSSSDYEVDSCSKSCVKAYDTLKEQYDSLSSDYKKSQFNLVSYKSGLESVEARLAHYKKNEAVFEASINVLNLEVKLRDNALVENKKKLEKAEKKRDELKLTLEKFQNSSKSLNNLLESQVSVKFKIGLGYNTATSTATSPAVESFVNSSKMLENYENIDVTTVVTPSNVKKVESNHESADVKSNGDVVEPKTVRKNSFRPPVIEDWNSNDDSEVEFIPNVEDKTVRPSTKKIKFVKSVRETVEKGNPQQKEYKEKGVIDSGCSRHMTGNKCYLTEYEDYIWFFVFLWRCKVEFSKNSQVLLRVPRKDNIYSVDLKSVVPTKGLTCLFAKATIDESNLWHRRLGHINFKNMNKLVRGNLVRGLPSKIFENDHSCVACQKGKQHKASYKAKLVNSISKPLHMLHMDLFRSTNVKSLIKKSYCLVVIDDFSRFSWVFFLATKDETSGILKTFVTEIENQLDHKVKVIRCDNGTEFKNSNGVAERRNRTLIEATRTILFDSMLPNTFWAEAVNSACYVLNRVLFIKPHNKTPYELIRGRTPLIDFMKPFGCLVTILNTRDHLGKRDNIVAGQAKKKIEPEQEYILIPICTTDPLISQDPKVSEEDAKEKPTKMDESGASDKDGEDDQATRSEFERLLQQEKQTIHTNSTNSINTISTPVSTAGPSCTDDDLSSPVNAAEASNAFEEHLFEQFSPFKNAFTLPPVLNVTLMNDTVIFSNAYDDEDVGAEADLNNLETTMNGSPIPTAKIDKDHPKDQIIGDLNSAIQTRRMTKISDEHAMVCYINKQKRTNHKDYQNCLFAYFLSQKEPKKVIQALEDPSWVEAMQEELLQFKLQKVFRNKKDERGIVVRNKARLVAQGYTQEEGIDYDEVFAHVARIEAIRLFLAYASFMRFIVYQMDVKSAFLYGTIGEETLSTYLIENGFRRGIIDKTMFIKKDKGDILLVQVYVDDIIFGPTKKSLCDEFEGLMHKRFQMSSMGELTFFLGLQVQQKEDGIFISQDKYVAEILKKFDFATVKTTSTPIETNKALVKDEEAKSVDVHLYRSMIGSLMYLIASRPDIMFAVCGCARFQVTLKTSHLHAMKRIFRYLKGQPKLGLWYPRDSPFNLEAFSDSDYAEASLNRKSTIGGVMDPKSDA
ncbi:putative ribonuclease H-like domain-containing protein [Tanacetum coccineum]